MKLLLGDKSYPFESFNETLNRGTMGDWYALTVQSGKGRGTAMAGLQRISRGGAEGMSWIDSVMDGPETLFAFLAFLFMVQRQAGEQVSWAEVAALDLTGLGVEADEPDPAPDAEADADPTSARTDSVPGGGHQDAAPATPPTRGGSGPKTRKGRS